MAKWFVVVGLAGPLVLASAGLSRAQDAVAQQAQDQSAQSPSPQDTSARDASAQDASAQDASAQVQQAPAPAQPSCASALACLFSGATPSAQPQPPQPQPAAIAQAPQEAANPSSTPGDADVTPKAKPRPKPAHQVTIAADAAEVERLRRLESALPRGRVKIVKAAAEGQTDFAVKTALDPHGSGERAKLFTEQMHIVATAQFLSLADLKDKVVSFGPEGSASQAVARKAFEALNIPVKETPLDLDNALDGLATGDVAAVVVLAPQPFARFARLSGQGLHLVSWPDDGALPSGAVAATIDAAQYPGLAKPDAAIRAVGVDAVLEISARGLRQPACRTFLNALAQHSAALSKHGFDRLKADLDARSGRNFASAEPH